MMESGFSKPTEQDGPCQGILIQISTFSGNRTNEWDFLITAVPFDGSTKSLEFRDKLQNLGVDEKQP